MKLKTWYWYLPELTPAQAIKLQAGLLSVFRMHLAMSKPMVGWMPKKKLAWIKLSPHSPIYQRVKDEIGYYINGFYDCVTRD